MINSLDFAQPFFSIKFLQKEQQYQVGTRSVLINLAETSITIQKQTLPAMQSLIVVNTTIRNINNAVLVENFERYGDIDKLFTAVKKKWALAYDVRKEERLRGVNHYMSPKAKIDNIQFSMYYSGSVPLNVGLHKTHSHCGDNEPKEIHTQLVGLGKMQQCSEKDLNTLYLEEIMAPGTTHKPMYDDKMIYPWHQYETITPSIFMAIEILPE